MANDNIKIVKGLDVEVSVKPNEAQLNETKKRIDEFIKKCQQDAKITVGIDQGQFDLSALNKIAQTVEGISKNIAENVKRAFENQRKGKRGRP